MQVALGEMHPIVKLTLDCLEYEPKDRPSAVDVLRRLKEVGRTIPQICAETNLELIRQISVKDKEIIFKRSIRDNCLIRMLKFTFSILLLGSFKKLANA